MVRSATWHSRASEIRRNERTAAVNVTGVSLSEMNQTGNDAIKCDLLSSSEVCIQEVVFLSTEVDVSNR